MENIWYFRSPTSNLERTSSSMSWIGSMLNLRDGGKLLYVAGRTTLVKSTLQAIPSYSMQIFDIPSSVINNINRSCANFLCSGQADHNKLYMVSWKRCCRGKKQGGGLRFKDIKTQNKAFLAKLGWNFITNSGKLWIDILHHKYCNNDTDPFTPRATNSASPLWKIMSKVTPLLKPSATWSVGRGHNILFFHDDWTELGPLRSLVTGPLSLREDRLTLHQFISSLPIDLLSVSVLNLVTNKILNLDSILPSNSPDQLFWKHISSGNFTVASAYHLFINNEEPSFPLFSQIWKTKILPRNLFFLWQTAADGLPIKTALHHRNIIQDSLCPRCHLYPETFDHAFRECQEIKPLCDQVLPSDFPNSSLTLQFQSWIMFNLQSKIFYPRSAISWTQIFAFLLRAIWIDRNNLRSSREIRISTKLLKGLSLWLQKFGHLKNQNAT